MRRRNKTDPAAEDKSSPGNGSVDDLPPEWLHRSKLDTTHCWPQPTKTKTKVKLLVNEAQRIIKQLLTKSRGKTKNVAVAISTRVYIEL